MDDMMIAYPNTRPMCSANCDGAAAAVVVSGAKLKTLSLEQQRRAVKVSASVLTTDPWQEALPGPARRQHAHPQRRHAGLRAGRRRPRGPRPRRAARLLRHRRARPLRQPHAVRGGRRGRLLRQSGATWRDGTTPGERVGRPASPRATRSPPPASPTSGRSATTSAARPATVRSRAPRSAWPTSSASARPAASTSWRSPPRSRRLRNVCGRSRPHAGRDRPQIVVSRRSRRPPPAPRRGSRGRGRPPRR